MGNKAKARARRLRQKLGWWKRNNQRQYQWQEAQNFMARGNTPRWNWLMETFKGLHSETQSKIKQEFANRYDESKLGDDQVMYEIMTEMGLILKGVDPCPPPKVYVTDAGAAEYDEVILVQELGKVHGIDNT